MALSSKAARENITAANIANIVMLSETVLSFNVSGDINSINSISIKLSSAPVDSVYAKTQKPAGNASQVRLLYTTQKE